MKIKEEKLIKIDASYGKLQSDYTTEISDNLKISYRALNIIGRRKAYIYYNFKTKLVYLSIGCKDFHLPQLILGIAQLKGETTEITEKRFVKKGSKKAITSIIVEESANYFITDTNRAFKKSDYEYINYKYNPKVFRIPSKGFHWISYKGYEVCKNNKEDKKRIIKMMEYYRDIILEANKYLPKK